MKQAKYKTVKITGRIYEHQGKGSVMIGLAREVGGNPWNMKSSVESTTRHGMDMKIRDADDG